VFCGDFGYLRAYEIFGIVGDLEFGVFSLFLVCFLLYLVVCYGAVFGFLVWVCSFCGGISGTCGCVVFCGFLVVLVFCEFLCILRELSC